MLAAAWAAALVEPAEAPAGPFLTPASQIPDQARSLAHLKRVQLAMAPLPAALVDAGIAAEELNIEWTRRLADAGLTLSQEATDPTLRLSITAVTESEVPDGVAFTLILWLEQPVRVEPIEQALVVPTYLHVEVALEATANVEPAARRLIRSMLTHFIDVHQAVSKLGLEGPGADSGPASPAPAGSRAGH